MRLNKYEIALALGLIMTILLNIVGFAADCYGIRQNVLRLHVIANSDTDEDQELKLKVRDRLLEEGSYYLESAANEEQAELIIEPQLDRLCETAEEEIRKNGYNYDVQVVLCNEYFETRTYEETTLPAGVYRAVKVIIGEGKGKNWWCVMFPPMCLPAAEESAELDAILDDDELEITQSEPEYEFRFKIVEFFESLFNSKKE